jgi:Cellulase (glycosyl hydrolase family 5)
LYWRRTESPFVPAPTAGSTFTARGNNYIRLAAQTDFSGNSVVYHSTFNVGHYDASRSETSLALMQARGFNTVRVFLNGCCVGSIGDPAGGLTSEYLANVTDFLARAKQHSIYVIFTQDWLPAQGGYDPTCPQYPLFEDVNLLNLCSGGVVASGKFQHDFVQALVTRGASLEAILAYELRNEYYYEGSRAPLSAASGTVTTANGSSYDMADPVARQRMMDDGLVYYTDQVRGAIRELDPSALVTVGFFWPQQPNPTRIGDSRLISVYPAIASSSADFVDIHGYTIPGDLGIDQLMQNYAPTGFQQIKPVIMGEFGAFQNSYALIGDAAAALRNWQIGGCPYHLKGWLLWTWDTDEQSPGLWTDQAGDGSIDQALAPASRPDPCTP